MLKLPTKNRLLIILFLFLIGFALYAPNLHNRLFWDDEDWVVSNPYVHNLSWENIKFIFSHDTLAGIGLKSNYFRPFLFLTFLLNYATVGTQPFFYHLVSNLIHISNGILIFFILGAFFKNRAVPFLAALMFIIHPLQTEAVTYISGRGDPLSVMLMLLALLFFLLGSGKWPGRQLSHKWIYSAVSYLMLILAILSRETAFLFPLYLMVFTIAFVYQDKLITSFRKAFISTLPYLGISLIYGVLRLTILNFQNTLNFFQQSNIYTQHLSYRIYTFLHVILVYLRLIFVPTGLHMERDILVNTSFVQWPVWFSFLLLTGILAVIIFYYRKEKTMNGELSPFRIWFFAWGFFFINLAPTSGIFPINAILYEHWLYFSLFGFFTLAAYYLVILLTYLSSKSRPIYWSFITLLAVYFSFLGFQSVNLNILWGKPVEFYENILRYEPNSVRAMTNLATFYFNENNLAKAEELYWSAIQIGDIQPQPYYNLGVILMSQKDYHGAAELFKKTIEVDKYFQFAYLNLASVYASQGDLNNAAKVLGQLLEIKPQDPAVYYDLAQVQFALGRKTEAKLSLQKGLQYVNSDKLKKTFTDFISKIK